MAPFSGRRAWLGRSATRSSGEHAFAVGSSGWFWRERRQLGSFDAHASRTPGHNAPFGHPYAQRLRLESRAMKSSMRAPVVWLSLAMAGALPGCGSDAGRAAVATAVAVGAVGINRAVTGNCWAQCDPGFLCDEKSGLCERGECVPGCPVGYYCVRDPKRHTICVRDPDAFSVADPAATAPVGPVAPPVPGLSSLDAGPRVSRLDAGADAGDAASD